MNAPVNAPAADHGTASSRLTPALVELLRSLQVDPAHASVGRRPRPGGQSYLVLPSPSRPNLLVPLHRLGAVVVEERAAFGLVRRAVRRALAAALRSGVAQALPLQRLHVDDPRLAELTGWLAGAPDRPVRLGIMLGPPRANRKAVVRVMTEAGETIGYAKVGTTPLTRALVRAEADNLALLAEDPPALRVPRVLRYRDDEHLNVLVTSPLARLRPPETLPHRETRELFLRHQDLDTPLDRVPLLGADRFPPAYAAEHGIADLAALRDRLMTVIGSTRLPLGDSHGDWAPQNMSEGPNGLEVWDWERYATGVPQGFDAVHFEAFRVHAHIDERARTEAAFLQRLPAALESCGIDPATTTPLLCLYLLWVAGRYDADLSLAWSSSTEDRLRWATGLLTAQLTRLEREKERP